MHDEEVPRIHNPVVHELSLAGWLVAECMHHEECWSSEQDRGHILRCCGEVVARVGELAEQVSEHDPEVATEVRQLTGRLVSLGEQLDR